MRADGDLASRNPWASILRIALQIPLPPHRLIRQKDQNNNKLRSLGGSRCRLLLYEPPSLVASDAVIRQHRCPQCRRDDVTEAANGGRGLTTRQANADVDAQW